MIDIDFDYSKVKGSTQMHNKFKQEFILTVPKFYPDVVVIPYDVSKVRAMSQPDIIYQVGQVGVPDTIVFGNSWYLLLDMKTGKATLQPNQKRFKKRIADVNKGIERVFKVKSVRQCLNLIREEISANE